MTGLIFTLVLWFAMLTFGVLAWRRHDGVFAAGLRDCLRENRFIIPRLAVGILGAGFVAAVLPPEYVEATLGPSSGLFGVAIALICGLAVPGGPVMR